MKKTLLVALMMLVVVGFTGCTKAPLASFSYWSESSSDGAVVHFMNNSTYAESCYWDFGDGDYSWEWAPTHTYTAEGFYTVTLHVYNRSKEHYATQHIEVIHNTGGGGGGGGGDYTTPTANFSFTGNNQYAPATVNFTNLSSNATSYLWNFGDGTTSSSTNPTHTYTSGGNYTVTLKATNNAGSNQTSKTVTVKNTPATWTLTKFVLTSYPLTDGGDNWDWTDAGPDIYFKLYDANNTLIYTSSTKSDVTESSLPLTWNLSNATLSTPTGTCTIKIYDEDGALDPDDLMGNITFVPADHCGYNNYSYTWTAGSWSGVWTFSWGY